MPTLILSTCGTSLLTNLAGERRNLVTQYANARTPDQVPLSERTELERLITHMRDEVARADDAKRARLSAELNGLLRYCGGSLGGRSNHHWLIATDTWLGSATAAAISEVLEARGHTAQVRRIPDLRTDSLAEFRVAVTELIRLCAQEIRPLREQRWRVVFNLTGGFKSVQGFIQALGMLYADESVYVFEGTEELLRLPRLPITLDAAVLVRRYERIFRRLAAGLPVSLVEARDVPETLLFEDGGQVTLSLWGDVIWAEAGDALLGERLWPPVDEKLRFSDKLSAMVNACSEDERRQVNQRLAELARHLRDPQYNPRRLDFKKLQVPHGRWTHECDAWASHGAKRLFGYFEGAVFVVDALAEGLH